MSDIATEKSGGGLVPKSVGELIADLVNMQLMDVELASQMASVDADNRAITLADLKRLTDSDAILPSELAQYLASSVQLRVLVNSLNAKLKSEQGKISSVFLRENKMLPCSTAGDKKVGEPDGIWLLVANPYDRTSINSATTALGGVAEIVVVPLDELDILLDRYIGDQLDPSEAAEHENAAGSGSIDMLKDLASGTPVVSIVNELLEQAIDLRATDIHLEPTLKAMNVRYRVDGVLRKMPERPSSLAAPIVSRIKVLAKLDIAERRKPQDGAARLSVRGQPIDLRIATLPTSHGESIVIRILARNANLTTLASMGIGDRDFAAINRLLNRPYGMIAVTGPTGSGKTTTLAAALSQLNDSFRKIVTIEDPIEYQIENIAQSQIRPEIGVTFATAIRAFVRQDPDIIMVGEIRDGDTAQAAVQAAQTGHLLLTTLHANTSVSAIARLRDLGVESYLLASNLRGVIAQRLVRVLCGHCKTESEITKNELETDSRLSLFGFTEGEKVFRANGCARCGDSGYRGRAPVFEVFEITNELALAIGEDIPGIKLQEMAMESGMTTLSQDAKRLVEEGISSPEEVSRVTSYL